MDMAKQLLQQNYPPPLPKGENERLITLYRQTGDMAAREKVILHNMRAVCSVAKKHMRGLATFDELLSAGSLTLVRSVEKFDPSFGWKFTTYLYCGVFHACVQCNQDVNTWKARLPQWNEDDGRRLMYCPTDSPPVGQHVADEWSHDAVIKAAKRVLDKRQLDVILDRAMGASASEISERLGVSRERVRQIEKKALKMIREELGVEGVTCGFGHCRKSRRG